MRRGEGWEKQGKKSPVEISSQHVLPRFTVEVIYIGYKSTAQMHRVLPFLFWIPAVCKSVVPPSGKEWKAILFFGFPERRIC